jgi:acyl-coenzyme A thioesterase PaaI-like protein
MTQFLDHMRRIASGEAEGAPMVRFENGLGIAHGGFAATMLDTALSCAVNTVMPSGKVFAGTLTCIGTVVHAGRTTATAEGRNLYAHGTVTCILFRDTTGEQP